MTKSSDRRQFKYQRQLNSDQFHYNQTLANQQFHYDWDMQQNSQMFNSYQSALANQRNVQNATMQQGWQQENMKLDSSLQYKNWLASFNLQNAYNDPSAQRARLQNAGYNPQLANGSVNTLGGSGMTSSASAGAPSVGSAPAASAGSSSVGLPSQNAGNAMVGESKSAALQALDGLSEIVNSAADVSSKISQIKEVKANARKLAADAFQQELTNQWYSMTFHNSDGSTITGDNGEPINNKQAQEMGLLKNIFKTGKEIDSRTNLNGSMTDYYRTKIDEIKTKYPIEANILGQTLTNLEATEDEIKARTDAANAAAGASKASANLSNEQAKTYKVLRPYEVRKMQAEADKAAQEAKLANEKSKTEKYNRQYLASGTAKNYADTNLSYTQARKMENDMYHDSYRFEEKMDIAINAAKFQGLINESTANRMKADVDWFIDTHKDGSLGQFTQYLGDRFKEILPIYSALPH